MPDSNKVLPIRPENMTVAKQASLPDAVITVFNELIIKHWDGRRATITQDEAVALMVNRGLNRKEIFDQGWLNVEDIYRQAGWVVEYDKPGYNETYLATFTFKLK